MKTWRKARKSRVFPWLMSLRRNRYSNSGPQFTVEALPSQETLQWEARIISPYFIPRLISCETDICQHNVKQLCKLTKGSRRKKRKTCWKYNYRCEMSYLNLKVAKQTIQVDSRRVEKEQDKKKKKSIKMICFDTCAQVNFCSWQRHLSLSSWKQKCWNKNYE